MLLVAPAGSTQPFPNLDQRPEGRLRRDEELPLAAPVDLLAHHANAVADKFRLNSVEILHIEGEMMQSLAMASDEITHEVFRRICARTLQKLHLETSYINVPKDKIALARARHRLVDDLCAEVAAKEIHRRTDIAHCHRNMVEAC